MSSEKKFFLYKYKNRKILYITLLIYSFIGCMNIFFYKKHSINKKINIICPIRI